MDFNFCYHAAEMEAIRADNEATMTRQIGEMNATKAEYESQASALDAEAGELESQAAAQDHIAATAMMTVYYTDSDGDRRSRQVPDGAKRSAARAKASELRAKASSKRSQAAALRAAASALEMAAASLGTALAETNRYIRTLMETVQQTDLSYRQMLLEINERTQGYITKMQEIFDSFNDSFPLTSEDVEILKQLDIRPLSSSGLLGSTRINPITGKVLGQESKFMEEELRTYFQNAEYQDWYVQNKILEYQKLHGKLPTEQQINQFKKQSANPTEEDLDNLFFLTDLRLDEKNEILFVEQLKLSENLYTLATTCPGYYKLADQYGLATPKYNEKMRELSELVCSGNITLGMNWESVQSYKKSISYSDAINNALIEQAIFEIKSRPDNVSQILDNDWYTFTETIQDVAGRISVEHYGYDSFIIPVPKVEGNISFAEQSMKISNISQIVHWERNAFNRIPETWDELIEKIYESGDQGWKIQMTEGSGYHMFSDAGIMIIKLHRDSGQEVIYNMKTGKIVPNNSTFNYKQQSNVANSMPSGLHRALDISPHNKWLENKNDYNDMMSNGINGILEEEAIATAKLAAEDDNYKIKRLELENELKDAKSGKILVEIKKIPVYDDYGDISYYMDIPIYEKYQLAN